MPIHIDRRQALPKIPKQSLAFCRAQILQETRSYIQYPPIVFGCKKPAITYLRKRQPARRDVTTLCKIEHLSYICLQPRPAE
jgi:hypothetical protein